MRYVAKVKDHEEYLSIIGGRLKLTNNISNATSKKTEDKLLKIMKSKGIDWVVEYEIIEYKGE